LVVVTHFFYIFELCILELLNLSMKNVIAVFTDDTPYGQAALVHAQKLAQIFDTELNVFSLHKKIDLHTVFVGAEDGKTLCFVMPVGQSKENTFFNVTNAKKWIKKSRVPVITVGQNYPNNNNNEYQQIILPLDINCQEKELALWASYFPAYSQQNRPFIPKEDTTIHIIYNQYKDVLLRNKVQNNVDFVIKLFDNLEVSYKLHSFTKINNIHIFGLEFAKKIKNSALLYLMPKYSSLIDIFFGSVSSSLLKGKDGVPVIYLNAREDNFMLCR